jgi:quercetin dioxygenase-like cupin family protein
MGTQAAQVGRAGGIVVQPGDGATFSGRGGGYTLVTKVTNDETRGAYAFQEMMVAPGFPWIPPHIHRNEDEALYVLEGECTVQVGEQVYTLGSGAFIFMPRDVVHTFSNPGSVPTRVLVISSPGSVIRYFEEAAALTNQSPNGQPDIEKLVALAHQYGIEFVSASSGEAT